MYKTKVTITKSKYGNSQVTMFETELVISFLGSFFQFQIIEKHVDSMLVKLPSLNLSCNEFLKKAQEINARYEYL